MSVRPLGKESGVPLYLQLRAWMEDNIYRQVWQPGELIPSETELMQRFGVSRTTVRQAIADLQVAGLVEKQQGRGTFVAHPKFEENLPSLRSFTEDVIAKGHVPRSIVIAAEWARPQARVADKLRIGADESVFKLVRLRLIDDEPVQIHTAYLPRWVAEAIRATQADFATQSLYAELEKAGIQLDEAEEILEASIAGDVHSSLLGIPQGAPLVITERQTFDRTGRVVEFNVVEVRGDRYRHCVKLKRGIK